MSYSPPPPNDDDELSRSLCELGLNPSTSSTSTLDAATIRAAFRAKAKTCHPDLNPQLKGDAASRKFARLSRALEVALAASRGQHYREHFGFTASPPESAISYLLRQRRVALGLSAALIAAGGGALYLSLHVHRDRYSRQVAEVVRAPPSEAAVAVSRMVEEARTDLKRRSRGAGSGTAGARSSG